MDLSLVNMGAVDVPEEQVEELETLTSIYPEILISYDLKSQQVKGTYQISIIPIEPTPVLFHNNNGHYGKESDFSVDGEEEEREDDVRNANNEIYTISNFPPITLEFSLPRQYPTKERPGLRLLSNWLPQAVLERTTKKLNDQWSEANGSVLFMAIDQLNQDTETLFGIKTPLVFNEDQYYLKDVFLSFDETATKKIFESQTFTCEICRDVKRGNKCTQLVACGHVFCTKCLEEYFCACIEQGYINHISCPEPNCARMNHHHKPELSDQEIKRLVGIDLFDRYTKLKRQRILESNPNTLICPRSSCQALIPHDQDNLMAICQDCKFAFCIDCKHSWHGKYTECSTGSLTRDIALSYQESEGPERKELEVKYGKMNLQRVLNQIESDELFEQYMLEEQIKPCPYCEAPIARESGCNKMVCTVCKTFFCFRCAFVLSDSKPYDHYGKKTSPCYAKLFEGTEIEEFREPINANILF